MGNARITSLTILEKCRRSNAWSDALIGSSFNNTDLDERDKRLATSLCYGVIQNQILLDYLIKQSSSLPMNRIEPKVIDILRLSIYQIVFMDRMPSAVAVSEGVELTKSLGFSRASSFVNALLRKIARGDYVLPTGNSIQDLSIRYSHPIWLVEYLVEQLGVEAAKEYLICDNTNAPIAIQINTNKIDQKSLECILNEEKVSFQQHPYLKDCLLISSGSIASLPSFRKGFYYIQDVAAKLSVCAANPQPSDRVLDVCAAPGGKTFAASILGKGSKIVSCDLHVNKLKRIQDGISRLGLEDISTFAMDARTFFPEFENSFNLVIADVPCSGLGVIRKKPDIRYKEESSLFNLPSIQYAILNNVCKYVSKGGVLIYSTCTIRREENDDIVNRFLSDHPCFQAEDFILPGNISSQNGHLQMWPHLHGTDGFYFAKMRNSCE